MKQFPFLYIIALFVVYNFENQLVAQEILFEKLYYQYPFNSSGKNSFTNYYCIESFSDGGYATIGFGTDTFPNALTHGFLTKYDCLGNIQWSKDLGISGSGTNTNFGIAEAQNGDLVYCFNQSPTWFKATMSVGRIDINGNYKWAKRIGTDSEFGRDMIATKDGGFVIAGSTAFYGTDRNQGGDIYLVKIDSAGNILWNKTYGNSNVTYDEAFSIDQDSKGNLFVVGRCINRSTFMCFVMKADDTGEPIKTLAIGQENQATHGYAVDVTSEDKVVLTGFTTILEANFQERSDLMLFKFDNNLNVEFLKVFDPAVGGDNGILGEGIIEMEDGAYAVVSETGSFTEHNLPGPQGAGKWLGTIFEKDGTIRKSYIYNHFGSQYPRICKAKYGGYFIGGFSTEWTQSRAFQGLVVKTDEKLLVNGCTEEDVTDEIVSFDPQFIVEDFIYQRKTGGSSITMNFSAKDSSTQISIICEEKPTLVSSFTGPKSACPNQDVVFKNNSQDIPSATHTWIVDGKEIEKKGDLTYRFPEEGVYIVRLIVSYACINSVFEQTIEIKSQIVTTIIDSLCENKIYSFRGKEYKVPGNYEIQDTISAECGSLIKLNLIAKSIPVLNISERICEKSVLKYNGKEVSNRTLEAPGKYTIKDDSRGECGILVELTLEAISFTPLFDTICIGTKFKYGNQEFGPGEHRYVGENQKTCITLMIDSTSCGDCVEVPNVFTPANGDDINDEFIPYKSCDAEYANYKFVIYNRWGQKVFETSDPTKGWDGRFKDQLGTSETYIYLLEYDLKFGEQSSLIGLKKKGDVTLLR
ncbi:MAG: gliding motility-associated C-terminal domain-containing protein [Saprospiraceae bacterium]